LVDPPNAAAVKKGVGFAHGTFGELLQGALRGENNHFLVTLPITRFTKVVFTLDEALDAISCDPPHKTKSLHFANQLIAHFKRRIGGHLTIRSNLPEGKGMASSSADMVATARALEASLGRLVPVELILNLLRAIEPTDGVMFPDFVSFFHRRVTLCRRLGSPSRLRILAIDEGGQVDTIAYNQRDHVFTDAEFTEYASLLEQAGTAISRNDLGLLGRVATRSAVLNQKRNPKRHLSEMLEISEETGALGVVVTHSGPCIGLLFPYQRENRNQIERAETRLRHLSNTVFSLETLGTSPLGRVVEQPARGA
jgi:L-threonine kinase